MQTDIDEKAMNKIMRNHESVIYFKRLVYSLINRMLIN